MSPQNHSLYDVPAVRQVPLLRGHASTRCPSAGGGGRPLIMAQLASLTERNAAACATIQSARMGKTEQGALLDVVFEWYTLSRKAVLAQAKRRKRDGRPWAEVQR